jgi:hypothetical protein
MSLLDLSFAYGVLEIPRLELNDSSESLFRNVIAFEQTYTYLNIIFYDSESSQERVNDVQTICLHSWREC